MTNKFFLQFISIISLLALIATIVGSNPDRNVITGLVLISVGTGSMSLRAGENTNG